MRGLCFTMLSVCLSFSAFAQESQPTSTASTQPTSAALSEPALIEEARDPRALRFSLVPTLVSYSLFGVGALLVVTDNSAEAFHTGRFLMATAGVGAALGPSVGEFTSRQYGKGLLGVGLRGAGVIAIGSGGSLFVLSYFSCRGATTQPCDPPGGAGIGASFVAAGSLLVAGFTARDLYASYHPTPRLYKKEQQALSLQILPSLGGLQLLGSF